MNPAGKDRNRQLVTVGIGTVLTLVMGAVLIAGSVSRPRCAPTSRPFSRPRCCRPIRQRLLSNSMRCVTAWSRVRTRARRSPT